MILPCIRISIFDFKALIIYYNQQYFLIATKEEREDVNTANDSSILYQKRLTAKINDI